MTPTRTLPPARVSTPTVSETDFLLHQFGVWGLDFATGARLVAAVEALGLRLHEVDRLQLGRLMVATGHALTLSSQRDQRR